MPNPGPYHIFAHDEGFCLINVARMTASAVDDPTIARVLKEISANPHAPVEDAVMEKLDALDLLSARDAKPEIKGKREPIPVSQMALFVTQQCNFRCIYCFGGDGSYGSEGEMSQETARKAVDWLIHESGKVKKLKINFFGGEPLLNFPLMQEVARYARRRGGQCGKQFGFGITTNGSLLDDAKIAFFKDHGITPLLSFDGPKEVQDRQRPFRNGKGSYETIVPKIHKLLEVVPQTVCRATLVDGGDPVAVDNALSDMGFRRRYVVPASRRLLDGGCERAGCGRDMSGMFGKAEGDARRFASAVKARDTETLRYVKESGVLCDLVEQFVYNSKKYFQCGAGRGLVGVSCSGDVYLCHRFVGMEGQKLGNVFKGGLDRENYLVSSLETQDACAKCYAKYLCAGGCYYDNLGAGGSVFEPAEDICGLMRRLTELSAAVCCRLSEDDKAYLVKEGIIEKKFCPTDLF